MRVNDVMTQATKQKLIAHVFGKEGCAKCTMLNRRLENILAKEPWKGRVEKRYDDVESEDGLVYFCLAQCVNPSRIPALLMAKVDETGRESFIERQEVGADDPVCGASMLYQYVGIQTDYSAAGKGIITPEMIEQVLNEAAKSC
jgi:hypothetical protein